MYFMAAVVIILLCLTLTAAYLTRLANAYASTPDEISKLSPHRWTPKEIQEAYAKEKDNPTDIRNFLPPKEGRRYIVVGGSGFVGSWIVLHLLLRGESPSSIRILDVRPPQLAKIARLQRALDKSARDHLVAACEKVQFFITDITDEKSVWSSFSAPWDDSVKDNPLTVFTTAAVIRHWERAKALVPLSLRVNTTGTENVVTAARKAGADVLVATSSGAVLQKKMGLWLAPWQSQLRNYLQVLDGSKQEVPNEHEDFWGNYAYTKALAEKAVRKASDPDHGFKTGVIRPCNGVYGSGGDATAETYLKRGGGPTWLPHVVAPFVSGETVSLAHILFAHHLANDSSVTHKLSGHAFSVTDPNPPIAFSDLYNLLSSLATTPTKFTYISAIPVLLVAYVLEAYSTLQRQIPALLPGLKGDAQILSPTLFLVSNPHLVIDCSEVEKRVEDGGLGLKAPWGTLTGLARAVVEWNMQHGGEDAARADTEEQRKRKGGVSETLDGVQEVVTGNVPASLAKV